MGRRFESCRAHHNSPVFTHLPCNFPLYPRGSQFAIVPIFVPTCNCYGFLSLLGQSGEGGVNPVSCGRLRVHIPRTHLNRAMSRNLHKRPNITTRCTKASEERVPEAV